MAVQHQAEFGEAFSWLLWSGAEGGGSADKDFTLESVSDPRMGLVIGEVNQARCFCITPEKPNGRAVLVLAGGGYTKLVIEKEGFEVARWLCALGFHVYVLVHRFPSARWAIGQQCGAQAPVDDAIEAMRHIRARAPGLGIDPHGVGVLGLSSGGHLAACLVSNYPKVWSPPESVFAEYDWRPDFLIAGYGPISTNASGRTVVAGKPPLFPPEKQELYEAMQPDLHLRDAPPPAFLVYASDDPVVPVENGRRLHAALEARGAHAELHVFAHAPHGFALRERDIPVGLWTVLCENWLRQIGMLPSTVAHGMIP